MEAFITTKTLTLDAKYSTTRLLIKETSKITLHESKLTSVFPMPKNENRNAEGGFRTKGYFKKPHDGKPLISVVTVIYNGEKYFEETIESVINQTYDNVEYIIIDGGSTDGTLDIIRKYEDRIDYWISARDNGIYDAMNKGIDIATTGGWINFMNAGDRFFDSTILLQISKGLSYDLIYGNHAVYKDNKNEFQLTDVKSYKDTRNIPFCHQSLFAKTELLKLNKFDTRYKIAADYHQYLVLKHLNATIKYVPVTICLYLDGGLSTISREKIIYEYYEITKKYKPTCAWFVKIIRLLKYYMILRKK